MLEVKHDRILVRSKVKDRTAGGFALAQNKEAKIEQGEIVACGPGRIDANGNLVPMSVKAGDQVYFLKPYDATDIEVDGEKLAIIMDQNVVAVITQ